MIGANAENDLAVCVTVSDPIWFFYKQSVSTASRAFSTTALPFTCSQGSLESKKNEGYGRIRFLYRPSPLGTPPVFTERKGVSGSRGELPIGAGLSSPAFGDT